MARMNMPNAIGGLLLVVALVFACGSAASDDTPSVRVGGNVRKSVTTNRRTAAKPAARSAVLPSDDWTFRPTVVVRRGHSQGSGTIISSVEGLTLVLTAAHVVKERGDAVVELHRYNLGLERKLSDSQKWPRRIAATVAAVDPAADMAILRIDSIRALPFVARLAAPENLVAAESEVVSVGIDLGVKLSSWTTNVVETVWFELNDSREERLFLITERPPQHGRSGGGLFADDGTLVGVCVGHAEMVKGRSMGVFTSSQNARELLERSHLASVLGHPEDRRGRISDRKIGGSGRSASASPASARSAAVAGSARER